MNLAGSSSADFLGFYGLCSLLLLLLLLLPLYCCH
jgi:hypothetical protein